MKHLILAAVILATSHPCFACGGMEQDYQISFKGGESPGELITVLRGPDGKAREVTDSIGYVGAHLGLTHILSSAKDASAPINLSSQQNTVNFVKSRLEILRKALKDYLEPKKFDGISSNLNDLVNLLNGSQVSKTQLIQAIGTINSTMYKSEVQVLESQRAEGASTFGKGERFHDLSLPSYIQTRGCNDKIAGFNSNVSGPMQSPAAKSDRPATSDLPSFSIKN